MPELPEVETIKNVIAPQIIGLTICDVRVLNPQAVAFPDADAFASALTGQTVASFSRRGKFLLFHMVDGDTVSLHLRMTGCLLAAPPDMPPEKHTHIIIRFENASVELRYSDPRRFGRFYLLKQGNGDACPAIGRLGIEPFDKRLSPAYLKTAYGKSRKPIKECLLSQNAVCGIGNIYSDEILFAARICPSLPANRLTNEQWRQLAKAIPERLTFFIQKNAVSAEEYLAGKGRDYRNTPYLQVYAHTGAPCPRCGAALCKTVIGGRSSVYCPRCQASENE